MMNIIFDATILTDFFRTNGQKSGVYYVAYNILQELLDRPDVNLILYVDPRRYAEELLLNRNFFPQANYLHSFSSYPKAALAKITTKLWFYHDKVKNHVLLRKLISSAIVLCQQCFKYTVRMVPSSSIIFRNADVWFSPINQIPKFVGKYKNIKPCIFLHDAIPLLNIYHQNAPKNFSKKIRQLINSFNSNLLFFANSEQTRKDFEKETRFVRESTTTITPLAASKSLIRNLDENSLKMVKKKYGIPYDKRYVFSLCTVEPRKNIFRVVRCFIRFIEDCKIDNLVLVLGGAIWDSYIDVVKKEMKNWPKDIVYRIGCVDDGDLSVLYSNAEWFVYTSQYEGFGLPPLEAMQCGCPVITSNSSSLPEVVGDAGIMIDWNSDDQHVDAYKKYYFNRALREDYSRMGLDRAKLFSWEKTVDKIIQVMKKNVPERNEKLNIIYRMCDTVNASSSGKRCFNVSKTALIKKCLISLKKNIEKYNKELSFYCIADNCSDDIISFVENLFPKAVLKRFDKIGNAKSFCTCIELATNLPNEEQVLFLEDDYLLLKENVLELLNRNLIRISREINQYIAIMPDDYPDRYVGNTINTECRVTDTGHFLRIDKTTCTFATYVNVIKKYKNYFLNFKNWPRVTENESINKVWKKVPLYQPIPAWTLHSQVKSVVPIYLDYSDIKSYIENPIL